MKLLMAVDNHICTAAVPTNGCLHDNVDCNELIATVYGEYICALMPLDCDFVVNFKYHLFVTGKHAVTS